MRRLWHLLHIYLRGPLIRISTCLDSFVFSFLGIKGIGVGFGFGMIYLPVNWTHFYFQEFRFKRFSLHVGYRQCEHTFWKIPFHSNRWVYSISMFSFAFLLLIIFFITSLFWRYRSCRFWFGHIYLRSARGISHPKVRLAKYDMGAIGDYFNVCRIWIAFSTTQITCAENSWRNNW